MLSHDGQWHNDFTQGDVVDVVFSTYWTGVHYRKDVIVLMKGTLFCR
jgi:hypothetical protein